MIRGIPATQKLLFVGLDKASSPEMAMDGSAEDCLDVYSDPLGALCTRNGMSRLNTTSVSSSAIVTGGWQFRKAGTNYDIFMTNEGKIYQLDGDDTYAMTSGLASTDDDIHWSCFNARDSAGALIVVMCHSALPPRKWDGVGGTAATTAALAGTMVTADWGLEWQRYYWLHPPNSNDLYYNTTIDNAESGYNSYLRYDTPDTSDLVTGGTVAGDDMLIFKKWSVTRTVFRPGAGASKFQKMVIDGATGTESHWSIQTLPTGQVVWLGPDNNFYMLSGNMIRPIGDLIQPFLRDCNQSRLKYVDSGINRKRGHYWITLTYGASSGTHNRVLVLDYLHPYQDKKGQLQYPWWVYSRGIHTIWEAFVGGDPRLYSGDYAGFINREDTGTSDAGTAIPNNGHWLSKAYSYDMPTREKKFTNLFLSLEYKCSYNMYTELILEKDAATSLVKTTPLSRGASALALWDLAEWDVDSWAAETPMDSSVHISRVGKILQVKLYGDTTASHPWRVYNFSIYVSTLKTGHRVRES